MEPKSSGYKEATRLQLKDSYRNETSKYVRWDGVVLPLPLEAIRVIIGLWFEGTLWSDWPDIYNREQRGEGTLPQENE